MTFRVVEAAPEGHPLRALNASHDHPSRAFHASTSPGMGLGGGPIPASRAGKSCGRAKERAHRRQLIKEAERAAERAPPDGMFQLGPRLAFTWYILGARPNCAQVFGHLRTQPTGNSKRLMLPRPNQGTRTKSGHKKIMKFENLSRRGEEIPSYCLPRKSESYDASSECCWTKRAKRLTGSSS